MTINYFPFIILLLYTFMIMSGFLRQCDVMINTESHIAITIASESGDDSRRHEPSVNSNRLGLERTADVTETYIRSCMEGIWNQQCEL